MEKSALYSTARSQMVAIPVISDRRESVLEMIMPFLQVAVRHTPSFLKIMAKARTK